MNKEENNGNDFITELDVTKFIASVHNRIKNDIGSDFVLSKLNDAEKEYVIERTQSAYKYKNNMEKLINMKVWDKELTKEEKTKIQNNANQTFDTLMIKPIMMNIMNRNIQENHLLEIIAMKRREMLESGGMEQGQNIGEQLMVNDEK